MSEPSAADSLAAAARTPVPESDEEPDPEPRGASGAAEADGGEGRSHDEAEETEDDEDDEDEDEGIEADVIPRSDAGALAELRSLGVSGVAPEPSGIWFDDPLAFPSPSESSASPDGSDCASDDDLSTACDSAGDCSGGDEASPRLPECWAKSRLEPEEHRTGQSRALMQRAMRAAGAHIELSGGKALVMAPSLQAREKALQLIEGMDRLSSQLQGSGDDAQEEAEAEAPEVIEVYTMNFPSARGMKHECVYPSVMEGLIWPVEVLSFDGEFPFKLDPFQQHACSCVLRHESVLVAANTSAGKTAVAEYAIALSLRAGYRVLYTSPLKALSNQKFVDLQRHFPQNVGLLTGDVSLHPDAQVVILTTEVLAAMLYNQLPAQPDLLDRFAWIVFDEAQYIGDERRGTTWEECLIFLPEHLRCVLLTATIPNTHAIAGWIARTRVEPVHVITSMTRPVPLRHSVFLCGNPDPSDHRHFVPVHRRWGRTFHPTFLRVVETMAEKLGTRHWHCPQELMGQFIGVHGANLRRLQAEAGGALIEVERQPPHVITVSADSEQIRLKGLGVVQRWLAYHGIFVKMPAVEDGVDAKDLEMLLCRLKAWDQLPLIGFCFEKKQCEQIALTLAAIHRMDFASPEKKQLIDAAIAQGIDCLLEEDRKLKQVKASCILLRRGIGVHHSGMLPWVKELTELLFARCLLDVVFATETFAIGLNMPAKTVVFCGLSKFDGHRRRALHSGEFWQMAGRAGRRGIDTLGRAVVLARQPREAGRRTVDLLWELYSTPPPEVCSRFQLRWSSLVHLLRSGPAHVGYALDRSFCEGTGGGAGALLCEGAAMRAVLHRRDYVDASGALLPKGEMVARLSVPSDPVFVAEVLVGTRGFAGLGSAQVFALCSCFVGDGPPAKERVRVEDRAVASTLEEARRVASDLYEELIQAGLEAPGRLVGFINARIHPGLANTTLLWAEGVDFTEAVQRSGVPVGGEGLLVRAFRRLDELMREVAFVCQHLLGLPEVAKGIQVQREKTRRGVLVVPSLYLGDAEDPTEQPIPPNAVVEECPFPVGTVVSLSPLDIGFSHSSCGERFRHSQVPVLTTARALLHRWIQWREIPPVCVFWHRGRFYTLANRRLAAARLWALAADARGGEDVRLEMTVASESEAKRWGWEQKFTTGFTQGRSIRIGGTNLRVGCSRESTTFGRELWESVVG